MAIITADIDLIRDALVEAEIKDVDITYSRLEGYRLARNVATGLPYTYPGGFCLGAMMVNSEGPLKFLRCWHTAPAGRDFLSRAREVARRIRVIKARHQEIGRYFVDYEVVDSLLTVGEEGSKAVIPGVVMDWVEGVTLIQYLRDPNNTSEDLRKLAEQFRRMCSTLYDSKMAHGDLSGQNVMVKDKKLLLVDYDSLYFDNMDEDILQPNIGTASYQHPGRESCKNMMLCCDNFSHHIIYVSILILSYRMDYRNKINAGDNDMYFEQEDLVPGEFDNKEKTRIAREIKDNVINKELDIISQALKGDYTDVPPLGPPEVPRSPDHVSHRNRTVDGMTKKSPAMSPGVNNNAQGGNTPKASASQITPPLPLSTHNTSLGVNSSSPATKSARPKKDISDINWESIIKTSIIAICLIAVVAIVTIYWPSGSGETTPTGGDQIVDIGNTIDDDKTLPGGDNETDVTDNPNHPVDDVKTEETGQDGSNNNSTTEPNNNKKNEEQKQDPRKNPGENSTNEPNRKDANDVKIIETPPPQPEPKKDSDAEIGKSYLNKDNSKAFEYFKKGADKGDPEAMFQLGECYYKNMGTPNGQKDVNMAMYWWKKAADLGHPKADKRYKEKAEELQ